MERSEDRVAGGAPAKSPPAADAQAQANVSAVMRYYEGPWERGELEVLDEVYRSDFVGHVSGMPDYDLDGLRALIVAYRAAFSDFKIRSDDVIATADAVVVRWRSSGRFTGALIRPTGKEVTTTGITVYHFREGRIAEHWTEYDNLGLIRALGPIRALGLRRKLRVTRMPTGQQEPASS
jgi:predicted ester cyclase